jgi:hypothetical protein
MTYIRSTAGWMNVSVDRGIYDLIDRIPIIVGLHVKVNQKRGNLF